MGSGGAGAGRRERTKTATRVALVRAALRLFAERGFDGVSTAAIARAAAVSQRTLYRYFATKSDLAVAVHEDRQAEFLRHLAARPGTEPTWNALVNAWTATAESLDDRRSAAHAHVLRLAATAAELQAALLAADGRFAERVEEAVLARGPADPAGRLGVRVTVATFCALDQVATRTWLEGTRPGTAARSEAQRRCGELFLATVATSSSALAPPPTPVIGSQR